MKPFLLASLATVGELVAATVLFRVRPIERRALALTSVYAAGLIPLVAASVLTPRDLGILPASLVGAFPVFDHLAAAFFYSAAYFGGVLQLYNLADRGFSLRIVIDLLERPDQRGTVDDVCTGYSNGRGMRWMYDKRVEGLVTNRLASLDSGSLALTESGGRMAGLYAWLRRLYHVEPAR